MATEQQDRDEPMRTALLDPNDVGTVRHLATFLAGVVDGAVDELAADIDRSDWLSARLAQAKAEALREAAKSFVDRLGPLGHPWAADLRADADRIESEAGR